MQKGFTPRDTPSKPRRYLFNANYRLPDDREIEMLSGRMALPRSRLREDTEAVLSLLFCWILGDREGYSAFGTVTIAGEQEEFVLTPEQIYDLNCYGLPVKDLQPNQFWLFDANENPMFRIETQYFEGGRKYPGVMPDVEGRSREFWLQQFIETPPARIVKKKEKRRRRNRLKELRDATL